MPYSNPKQIINKLTTEEHLENPNDPTDKDWDSAIDSWLNGVDPNMVDEEWELHKGENSFLAGIVEDIEHNGSGGFFFDDNYPRGIPYNKVSDERKKYAQNKIAELVNSKYDWLKKYL